MKLWQIVAVYFLAINLIAAVVCVWDKSCAKRGARRVPEHTLLMLSALGGSPAFWASMYAFHHKTRKPKFYLGVPAILVVQLVLIGFAWYQGWLAMLFQ